MTKSQNLVHFYCNNSCNCEINIHKIQLLKFCKFKNTQKLVRIRFMGLTLQGVGDQGLGSLHLCKNVFVTCSGHLSFPFLFILFFSMGRGLQCKLISLQFTLIISYFTRLEIHCFFPCFPNNFIVGDVKTIKNSAVTELLSLSTV